VYYCKFQVAFAHHSWLNVPSIGARCVVRESLVEYRTGRVRDARKFGMPEEVAVLPCYRKRLFYAGKACAKPPAREILEWRSGGCAKFCARNFECKEKSSGLLQHRARTELEIYSTLGYYLLYGE
jgi:hypothetical protein